MGFKMANIGGRAALVDEAGWYDLERLGGDGLSDPMAAVAEGDRLDELAAALGGTEPDGDIDAADLGPPVPRPRHCYGIGLNYATHVAESGQEVPTVPVVFTKFPGCIVGPTADVELRTDAGDYEAELVVVIGRSGRDIPVERAWELVAGVTAGQDISDRALQFAASPPHFDLGKSRDTYGPIGPLLVSPDLLDDRDAVPLRCAVNGDVRQDDSTANLIFSVPELVAYLSTVSTLAPGDVIFTGTPDGVGVARGDLLVAGDVITTTVEGVGTLVNTCVTGS